MNALGDFLSDIGSTFVGGSLNVLETLGKATFEKLTVPRQVCSTGLGAHTYFYAENLLKVCLSIVLSVFEIGDI